jgi:AcrR family transcriptional regulator
VGRGEKVRAAVHAATIVELAEGGYAGLTIEHVARRAGVHKTTIYRRWIDRQALVIDAVSEHVLREVPVPDTGTLEGDLCALARGLARWMHSPLGKAILSTMISELGNLPEVQRGRKEFYKLRFEQAGTVVDRAIARGELPEGTNPDAVLKTMAAPLYFRLLVLPEPIDDEVANQAARVVMVAAREGLLCTCE